MLNTGRIRGVRIMKAGFLLRFALYGFISAAAALFSLCARQYKIGDSESTNHHRREA
jgi:hypothetical protein